MRSAIVITPQGQEEWACTQTWMFLLEEARFLSNLLNQDVEILLQHSLKHDEMGVILEAGLRTFSGVAPSFNKALTNAAMTVRTFRKEHEKLLTTKEQAAREASSTGRRRASSERKRVKRIRKG